MTRPRAPKSPPVDFSPVDHRLVPIKGFEGLAVGDEYALPARTVTEAHFSLFQALSSDNHPIHYDAEYCRRQGHQGPLAHGFQVLAMTAAGAGLFPHELGESLVGFLGQSSEFLAPVYAGDTLYPRLTVHKLERQQTTGVVTLQAEVFNQRGVRVLVGEHRYLARLRRGNEV